MRKPPGERVPKNESFLLVKEIEERERLHIAAGNQPRVFYHPGFSANGAFRADGQFEPHGIPAGHMLDLEAWEAGGKQGAAPVVPVPADPVAELEEQAAEVKEEIAAVRAEIRDAKEDDKGVRDG